MSVNVLPSSTNSPDSKSGLLVVVSGPSGVGKSTILRRLSQEVDFSFSVSATTREPRPGEIEGVHYSFVEEATFRSMIESGELVEWAEYGGNLYGTPVDAIRAAQSMSEMVVLDIELEGARQVRSLFPDALLIWVSPPSFADLEQRLRDRGDTSEKAVVERLERARRDMAMAPDLFDSIVVNDDVDRAVRQIISVVDDRRR